MFRSSISIFGIRTPRPDQDVENPPVPSLPVESSPAPQSQSRFARFSGNARTMVGSSVYSQSPGQTRWKTPKMPSLGFARRPVSTDLSTVVDANTSDSAFASHSAASYVGAISQEQIRTPAQTYRHPADVPLPSQDPFVDPEIQQLADEINRGPRRHRRRKRRRQHRADHWTRKRSERGRVMPFVRGTAARGKLLACIISGTILLTVLTIYLAIALTNKSIGQEIHILFILLLLSITIFFCHSLIRLCMLLLNPPPPSSSSSSHSNPNHLPVPSLNGPQNFNPRDPIPVRLARDDDLSSDEEPLHDDGTSDPEKSFLPPPPPPAYGLWRSSVRVDPNLLHWRRVEGSRAGSAVSTTSGPRSAAGGAASVHDVGAGVGEDAGVDAAVGSEREDAGPRPPSYVSEDGVRFSSEGGGSAEAQGLAGLGVGVGVGVGVGADADADAHASPAPSGVQVHPAWRASYVMSEIRPGEVPAGVGRR